MKILLMNKDIEILKSKDCEFSPIDFNDLEDKFLTSKVDSKELGEFVSERHTELEELKNHVDSLDKDGKPVFFYCKKGKVKTIKSFMFFDYILGRRSEENED